MGESASARLPVATMSTTLTASDATTVRPREAERERLRCATKPGTPKSFPAAPILTWVPAGAAALRRARFERRTSWVWRMASTADTRAARRAGTQALATSVASESAAAAASTAASTCTGTPPPVPTSEVNASCDRANAPTVPATPSTSPSGTPTAPSTSASASTVRRSCRLDAPSEAKSPNCRVRSATEMAKAL